MNYLLSFSRELSLVLYKRFVSRTNKEEIFLYFIFLYCSARRDYSLVLRRVGFVLVVFEA